MKKKKKKAIKKIDEDWGKQINDYRNFDLIESYSEKNTATTFHKLNAQTKNDIDFKELFSFLDRTNSKPGQQFFYDKLTTPTNNLVALKEFDNQVNFFIKNKTEREIAQFLLSQLNNGDAYYIAALLNDGSTQKPLYAKLYLVDTVVVILMLLASIKFPVLLIWILLPLMLNVALHYKNKKNINRYLISFPQLNMLINVSKSFFKFNIPFNATQAKQSISALSGFKRKFSLINLGNYGDNEIVQFFLMLFEFIKIIFLIEIHSFYSIIKTIQNKKNDIDSLIKYVGSIDAALSVASLRMGVDKFSIPIFTETKKELKIENVYHPLIENCVANSIAVNNKSILVTGSNMSGKSTFIRAVIINSILSQTIHTCFADSFETPFLKVFSSIRIEDNLHEGSSYYFKEVNAIGTLITASQNSFQHLFILDEVFKGTNTIERVSAAKAILSYLNKNDNIVFVSSHDIELVSLLQAEYDLYHFVEDISNDELVFDHKIKQGELKSRNAIKILQLSNYPKEIVNEANNLTSKN